MMIINNIFEKDYIFEELKKRNLIKQYQKSKSYLLNGIYWKSDLKLRKPKKDWVYSFRINKQFRALSYLEENNLIVYKIDNHQK